MQPESGPWLGRVVGGTLRALLRVAFGTATLATIIIAVIYFRLSQGPVHLPFAAEIATRLFNEDSDRFEAALGDVVLTLGEAGQDSGAPPGIQFVDLRIVDAEGQTLFAVPRLAAKFDPRALLRGEVRPTNIVVIRPEARLLRTAEGNLRFGLGDAPAAIDAAQDELVAETPQLAAITRILDGLAGDAPLTPELSELREVSITEASFTYENAKIDRRWHTRSADLTLSRTAYGLRAQMSIGLADGIKSGARVTAIAERRRGYAGATRLDLRFNDLRPEHLAEQIEQMQWLRLFDAPLNGNLSATLFPNGQVDGLAGRISAGRGRILALQDEGLSFNSVSLAFAYETGLERMQVSDLTLTSQALNTQLSGFVDLRRLEPDEVSGLAGQFEVNKMHLDLPQQFAEPLEFDGGQLIARLNFAPLRIEVENAHLRTGDLVLEVGGAARKAQEEWQIDLRAAGRNLSIPQLLRHWPLAAAGNPRAWIEKNIRSGSVDEVVAQMRFGAAGSRLNLDFRYSDLISSYLGDMTPIQKAAGRGSLTLQQFYLGVDSAEVEPVKGAPVSLQGSDFRVLDIQNRPWPARATIRAFGPTSSILALIDEQPLGLVAKLGLDPASVKGQARVTAVVGLPLLQALELGDVDVTAEAQLTSLQLPFRLPDGQLLDVAGEIVALSADKKALSLSGPVVIDGAPMRLAWDEFYGRGSSHRSIALEGAATPALLARFDLDTDYFTGGQAPMKLRLTQTGSPNVNFDLDADVGPAQLEIGEFNWTKPPGQGGRLQASGDFGDGIRISTFQIDTRELKTSGAAEFKSGSLQKAKLGRVQFRGLADVSLAAERMSAGGIALKVAGNRIDLALFDDPPGTGAGQSADGDDAVPLNVDFAVDEMVVTPKVIARPAVGHYRRDPARNNTASLDGRLTGLVQFTAEYEKLAGKTAEVLVNSDDAGALLKAAGLFPGATGGSLVMRAQIDPEPGTELVGVARIKDVRISRGGTFNSILDKGGVKVEQNAAEAGGYAFDKVRVPFELREGKVVLGDTTAKGNLMAIKLEGTIDETSDEIDLVGVISPAYALTGVLDSIPLIGVILSGGKGEGILAMTFRVNGTLDDPNFSVNPLSLLTPGILRNVFSGRGKGPNQNFIDNLNRQID